MRNCKCLNRKDWNDSLQGLVLCQVIWGRVQVVTLLLIGNSQELGFPGGLDGKESQELGGSSMTG